MGVEKWWDNLFLGYMDALGPDAFKLKETELD